MFGHIYSTQEALLKKDITILVSHKQEHFKIYLCLRILGTTLLHD
jgi:hypothetical protein